MRRRAVRLGLEAYSGLKRLLRATRFAMGAVLTKANAARSASCPQIPEWIRIFPYRREAAISAVVLVVLMGIASLVGPSEKTSVQDGSQEAPQAASQNLSQAAPMAAEAVASNDVEAAASEDQTSSPSGASRSQEDPFQPGQSPLQLNHQASVEPFAGPGQSSLAPVSETQSAYWLIEGRKQLSDSRIADARTSFAKSLKLARVEHNKKAIADASTELGHLHLQSNALNDAHNAFKQSLALYEELVDKEGVARSYRSLGVTLRHLGRYSEAEQMYVKAARLDEATISQEDAAADYNGLALVYLARGRYDLAEQSHIKALEIYKKLRQDQGVAEGYANLGQVYYRRGEFDRSADMFKKAIAMEGAAELKSGAGTNYSNLGAVFQKKGDLPAACVYWSKAREILRNNKAKQQLERVEATMGSEGCGRADVGIPVVRDLFSFLGSLTETTSP